MTITSEFPIYQGERYAGMLFSYADGTFSHSLLNHGAPRFTDQDDAILDFFATKARLPDPVHYAIFGNVVAREG